MPTEDPQALSESENEASMIRIQAFRGVGFRINSDKQDPLLPVPLNQPDTSPVRQVARSPAHEWRALSASHCSRQDRSPHPDSDVGFKA